MADFFLDVRIDPEASYEKIKDDIIKLEENINSNPPKIKLGIELNNGAIAQLSNQLNSIDNAMTGKSTATIKTLSEDSKEYFNALKQVQTMLDQVTNSQKKWTAAQHGKSNEAYKDLGVYKTRLQELQKELLSGSISQDKFNKELAEIRSGVSVASSVIKAAGENTQTWAQRVGSLSAKFSTWFNITQVIMAAYRAIRQMVTSVIELDTAMTELKKVTDETDATYERFLTNAATRAKKLGATMSDVATASADFARLGFNIGDAERLADVAIVYKNVGDGIEDINTASESIIATMQAFGIGADEAMSIVDKFNAVGNNYAISSVGVGEALLRSAAAMKSANNTLDETIALATAANTIIQNPETVGTTLKTVSMYLRASKTEAEEAGEATDGMASSMSELRDEILALTGNKVDIQIDEDTYKSTYEILKDLSEVWDDLTDLSQANIIELTGGKRNANVISAILENFEIAEKALETSANSAGSALAENEKYLKSIEGKISQFKASFQELSTTFIQSGFVASIVEAGTCLLGLLKTVGDFIKSIGGLKTVLLAVSSALLITKGGLLALKVITNITSLFHMLRNGIMNIINIIPNAIAAWQSYAANVISASTAMQATIPVVGLVLAAITSVIGAISLYNSSTKEASEGNLSQEFSAAADEANRLSDSITTLTGEYLALSKEVQSNSDTTSTLADKQEELRKELGLTKIELDELIAKYGSATEALMAYSIAKLEDAERDLQINVNTAQDELTSFYSETYGSDVSTALIDAQNLLFNEYGENYSHQFIAATKMTAEDAVRIYHDFIEIMNTEDEFDVEIYRILSEAVGSYEDAISALNANLAEQYTLQQLSGKELPKTQEEFNELRQSIITSALASGKFVGSEEMVINAIDSVLEKNPELDKFYDNIISNSENAAGAVASLSDQITTLSKMTSAGDAMRDFLSALNSDDGISFKNITDLASALDEAGISSENYISRILDAGNDTKKVKGIMEDITYEMISNALATGDLTSESEKLLAVQLKSIGVANAEEVAHNALVLSTLELSDVATITKENIQKFANTAKLTEEQIYNLIAAEISLNNQELTLTEQIKALENLAIQAGISATAITAARNAAFGAAYDTMPDDFVGPLAKDTIDQAYVNQLSQLFGNSNIIDLEMPDQTASKGGTKDANLEAWNKLVKEKKHLVEMDRMTQEEYYNWLASAYKSNLKDTEKYADEIMSIEKELYDWEKERIQSHIDDEKALLDYKRTKGEISEEEYFNKVKEIYDDGYNELQKAVEEKGLYGSDNTERLQAETEFLEEVKQAHNDAFDAERQALEHKLAMNLITEEQYLIELQRLYNKYYAGNEMYSEEAMEIEEELYDKKVELVEKWADAAAQAIEEMTDAMKQSIEAIQQLIQDSIDTHEENFDLEKSLLDHALAMNYISEEEYYKSLEDLYKSYFKDKNMYTEQYWANQEEVYQHEQAMLEDSASAIEDVHAKVVEMIKKELEDAVSAIEETKKKYLDLIEIRREALSDLKDEEDYEKERAEQLSTISELQRQLNALSYDTSAAGVAKYKEAYAKLQEAQKKLEEMENNRAYDVMNDQLDDEEKSVEVKYDAQISEYEDLVNNNEYLVDEAWARLSDKNSNLYNELMEYNKKYSTSIKDDITGSWETATKALNDYTSAKAGYESINGQIGKSGMSDAEYSEFQKITQGKQIYNWASTALDFGASMLEIGAGLMGGMMSLAGSLIGGPAGTFLNLGSGMVGTFAGLGSSIIKVLGGLATGTNHVPKTGWYKTNELGDEINLVKDSSGNEYRLLTEGSHVVDAESTSRLMSVIKNPSLLADWSRGGALTEKMSSVGSIIDSSVKEITVSPVFQIQSSNPEGVVAEIRRMIPEITKNTIKNILNGVGNTGIKQRTQHLY